MSCGTVSLSTCGATALVVIANPPVNCLPQPVREALWHAIAAADDDPAIAAIVIAGDGRGFCAGGDLAELRSPLQQAWPGISNHLLPRIEACSKPVIAAMHGFAIGGGFELALACHHRVAERRTRVALPEMKHGVLPPSGSQRLPRAVGVRRALDLILAAEPVAAETYADTPLFDILCDDDALNAAVAFAERVDRSRPPVQALLRHRPLQRDEARADLAAWRARLTLMQHCVDAVESAVEADSFDAGLAAAKRLHDRLAEALRR